MDVSFECPCCGQYLQGKMPRRATSLKCPSCRMEVQPPVNSTASSTETAPNSTRPQKRKRRNSAPLKTQPRRKPASTPSAETSRAKQAVLTQVLIPALLGLALVAGSFLAFAQSSPQETESSETTDSNPEAAEQRNPSLSSSSPSNSHSGSQRATTETPPRKLPRRTPVKHDHIWSSGSDSSETARSDSGGELSETEAMAKAGDFEPRPEDMQQSSLEQPVPKPREVAEATPSEPETTTNAPAEPKLASTTTASLNSKAPSWPRLDRVNRGVRFPAPKLSDTNLDRVHAQVWYKQSEMKWRNVRWHTELEDRWMRPAGCNGRFCCGR